MTLEEDTVEPSPRGYPYSITKRPNKDIILETQLNMNQNDLYNYLLTNIGLDSPVPSHEDRMNKGLNSLNLELQAQKLNTPIQSSATSLIALGSIFYPQGKVNSRHIHVSLH